MIITRTPLRISFAGGGSDLASFYENEPGAVISTTINKYIYITINKKFDDQIRASYSITEFAQNPKEIKHELIRESLIYLGFRGGIEITSISDIHSRGTGLGSSSSYTVGLLNVLYAYKGKYASPEDLGREACHIEIKMCGNPIGKQDQYAAAYGGLNFIQFLPDGTVSVDPIICKRETKEKLQNNLLMFYTGLTRSASNILKRQSEDTQNNRKKRAILSRMVALARESKRSLEKNDLETFGKILHENWELKKQLSEGISTKQIDGWYIRARKAGALGGKILGAGGGGFLLVYVPKQKHKDVVLALSELKLTNFRFEQQGSKVIYFENN